MGNNNISSSSSSSSNNNNEMTSPNRRASPSQGDEHPPRASSPEEPRGGTSADSSSASSTLARAHASLDLPTSPSGGSAANASDADRADLADTDHEVADTDRLGQGDPATGEEISAPPRTGSRAIDEIHGADYYTIGDDTLFFTDAAEEWGWHPRSDGGAHESGDGDHVGLYPEIRDEISDYGQYLRDFEDAVSVTEDDPFVLRNGAWYRVRDEAGGSREFRRREGDEAGGRAETSHAVEENVAENETPRGLFAPASPPNSGDDMLVLRVEHSPTPSQASWRNTRARGASSRRSSRSGEEQAALEWTPPDIAWGRDSSSGRSSPQPSPRPEPPVQGVDVVVARPQNRSRTFRIVLGLVLLALVLGGLVAMGPTGTPPLRDWDFPPFSARQQQTHYDILQVPANAMDEQIRGQYRKLVRAHHPDKLRVAAADPRRAALEAEANAKVQELHTAYQGLSGMKRCDYDFWHLGHTSADSYFECIVHWQAEEMKWSAEEYFEVVVQEEEEKAPSRAALPELVQKLLRPMAERAKDVAVIGHGWWQLTVEALKSKLAVTIRMVTRERFFGMPVAPDGREGGGR